MGLTPDTPKKEAVQQLLVLALQQFLVLALQRKLRPPLALPQVEERKKKRLALIG